MMNHNCSAGQARKIVGQALLILPAVLLGVLAMIRGGVSAALWGQQLAAWAVFALLAGLLRRVFGRISAAAWSVLLLLVLALALFGEGAGGAKRWIDLGVFQMNAAMFVLPALLVVLCGVKCPYPVLLGAAAVLCVQPSFMQLTAFACAALPVLLKRKEKLWGLVSVCLLAALVIRAACMPVSLEPAAYCEGILTMLGEVARPLQAAGWAALAAVPACWLALFCRGGGMHALSLAVYYALLLAAAGNEPVLFMGFGLSPIAGYFLACCMPAKKEKN